MEFILPLRAREGDKDLKYLFDFNPHEKNNNYFLKKVIKFKINAYIKIVILLYGLQNANCI
jgi:hypothetical protein